ncbi:MAG: ABC transporter permease/substrate-binding protein, partial [Planctomycetota bacterium]
VEAARAMGMTPGQVLRKVQLPLAAPVILAGVRTSSVWVIGTATLATPVGGESLGNYIFFGLATSNHLATLFGCVFAAGLAILFDLLIRGTEIAARRRSYVLGSAAGMALVAIVVVGLQPTLLPIGSDEHHSSAEVLNPGTGAAGVTDGQTKSGVSTAERLSGQKFVMGSKPFPESYVLADLIARQLSSAGAEVDLRPNMGSTILFDALRTNEVDAYVDYTGTIWTTVMKRDEAPGRLPVLIEVADFLKDNHGVICLGALGFENAYSLAMRRDRAQELGINSIADLARVAMINPLKIGGDPEIFGRPEWTRVRNAYNGLGSLQTVTMQSVFMYNAVRDGQVDVITAYSSDGRIAAYDLIVLDDPKQAFPPYDAILLLSPEAARTPGVVDALWPLVNSIPDDLMRRANMKVSVEKESPERAAGWLREEINSR